MTIEEMKQKKKELGLTYAMISQASGIPIPTLQKIFHEKTKSPRYNTICALEQVFNTKSNTSNVERSTSIQANDQVKKPYPDTNYSQNPLNYSQNPINKMPLAEPQFTYGTSAISDASAENTSHEALTTEKNQKYIITPEGDYIWTMQGSYTVEDYLALPEEKRVELIDGVIYDMGAPRYVHQLIAGEIHRQIANYILDKDGRCRVYIAPADVQLDKDNRTMVQPDVFILCDPEKSDNLRMYGAPDFALEVISPSTKKKDFAIKTAKYMNAGVREYWILDPYQGVLLTYYFEEEDTPKIHGLDNPVPVRIYEGDLVIDLQHVVRYIQEAKEQWPLL